MSMDRHSAWDGLFSDKPFEFRFGVHAGNAREFFAESPEHRELIVARMDIISTYSERHLFQKPIADKAVKEFAGWAGVRGDCLDLAMHLEQDFIVLLVDEAGREIFQAGVVCFPSSWRPEEKIGLPVHEIHSPVPTLNERLGNRIDKFLACIETGTTWERTNWGMSCSSKLNQHPDCEIPKMAATFGLDEVWVRREDQVLFRLPETKALIFGINVINIPVAEIAADADGCAGLQRAVETMSEDIAVYKNMSKARVRLLDLLATQ